MSSSLDPGVSEELYFDLSTETTSCGVQRYIPHTDDPHQQVSMSELYTLYSNSLLIIITVCVCVCVCVQLMKKIVITSDFEKRESAPPIYQSLRKLKKMKKVSLVVVNSHVGHVCVCVCSHTG